MAFNHPIRAVLTDDEWKELVRKVQYCEASSITSIEPITIEGLIMYATIIVTLWQEDEPTKIKNHVITTFALSPTVDCQQVSQNPTVWKLTTPLTTFLYHDLWDLRRMLPSKSVITLIFPPTE